MARLKTHRSRLTPMASRIGRPAGDRQAYDRERTQSVARRWYKTAEWQRLREATLLRDHFTCRMCGKGPQVETSKLVADHRTPHRGDRALFFDAANLWTLCASPCHNKVKQAEERRADL